jgi:adenosylhomocysteine nucleosidase
MATPSSERVAIVAALEREIEPAVRGWQVCERAHEGRNYKFYENERAVLVCGGIGAEAARRAAEAAIIFYRPRLLISVGFAGSLGPELKAGEGFAPRIVVSAEDGSRIDTGGGEGTLVSFGHIANGEQKARLARAYAARAVDMEAAAVARAAQAHGLAFSAYKAVSDEHDFEIPALENFIRDGKFRAGRFVAHALLRPWMWPKLAQLSRNTSRAAAAICQWLIQYSGPESVEKRAVELHPIKRA